MDVDMDWSDIYPIALSLIETYPNTDFTTINFVDLKDYILQLKGFIGNENHCGEKILEAIQAAVIEESS